MTYTQTNYADTERRIRISTAKGTTKKVRVYNAFCIWDGPDAKGARLHTVGLHALDDKGLHYFLHCSNGRFWGFRVTAKGNHVGPEYTLG